MKDHPFTDGNKRIGSLLFLLYLNQESVAHRLNPQALTALTLLIAESASSGKDLMVRLVVNLLAEGSCRYEFGTTLPFHCRDATRTVRVLPCAARRGPRAHTAHVSRRGHRGRVRAGA